jgi:hypothetical protein
MRNTNVVKIVACLILGVCAQIPAIAQTPDSNRERSGTTQVPIGVPEPVDDQNHYTISAKPILRHHLMLPASAPARPGQPRIKPRLRVATGVGANAVKTGTGIVITCDANVPSSTCNYLNTTVAGYYNNIFLNANANIYVKFGTTGLGGSDGYINLIHYTPYVTDLTNKPVKSSIQASALSSINTYATPAYGTQNIMGISVALGAAFGFTGLAGINADETAPCTPYTSGCYNEVITVADAASQANGGFTLYYDDQGGSEGAGQYDFYAVVQHEIDEVLGTSSCISTQNSSGLTDVCDGPVAGSNGIPSTVDLLRYASPGKLALNTTPSTTAGQYYSYDGGVHYGIGGDGNAPKVYNTLDNGNDFADYASSSPDCGTNQAIQDAQGCPGEDGGLTVLNDGESELTILNTDGFDIPEAAISSPTPGSTLSGSSATFTWSAVPGSTAYFVYVGTTGLGSSNIFSNSAAITATSQAVTGLPTSGTIYVRIYSYVGGFFTSVDFTYTGGSGASSPTVSLSPTSLTFASTAVGATSAAQVVTLKNTGTSAVTINSFAFTGANSSSFVLTTKTCSTSLAAGASCTLSVAFKPASAGTFTASLATTDNAAGSPQLVTLSGTGTAASTTTVAFSPTTLTFPSTQVGATSAAQVITLKNTGTTAVTVQSFAFTGTNASSFVLTTKTCTTSLAVGAGCTLSVAFKPASAGTLTASLATTDNASGSPQMVTLSGTATAAATTTVAFSPTSVTFPSTTVGATSAAQVITLKNTGTTAVTVQSFTFAGANASSFVLTTKTCTTSLAVGASCTLSVSFKPASAGTFTASLAATDNATGSPQTVALSGTGTAASSTTVSLSPSSLTFPTTAVGSTSAAQVITFTNTGTVAVSVQSFLFGGANASSFVLSAKTCTTSLPVGSSCTLSVSFKPTATGVQTATISATDNAAGSPQSVTLSGTGGTASSSTLTLTPASITFPATISGTTSDAQLVTLTNSGTTAITFSSILLGGTNPTSFIELSNCGTSLAANTSCTLYVAFKPTTTGALSSKVTITDNAAGSPQSVTLIGTGTTAPSVKLSVSSIAFPTTKAGSKSPAQMVTLTNTGTATLNLTSISLAGSNPTAFEAIDTCGATLTASASCTVYVAFAPITTGSFSALLTIADNGAASPQSVTLTGTGN